MTGRYQDRDKEQQMIQFQQFHPRFSTNRRLQGCGLPTSNSCLIVIGNRQWQWPNWYKIIVLILNIARDPLSIQIKHHVRYLWCKNYRHWQSQIILLHIFIPRFHSLAIRISPHILSIPKIPSEIGYGVLLKSSWQAGFHGITKIFTVLGWASVIDWRVIDHCLFSR